MPHSPCFNLSMDTKTNNTPKLMPLAAMAHYLGIRPKALRAEADAGRVPCVRAGDAYLFNPPAVEAALLDRARGGEGDR